MIGVCFFQSQFSTAYPTCVQKLQLALLRVSSVVPVIHSGQHCPHETGSQPHTLEGKKALKPHRHSASIYQRPSSKGTRTYLFFFFFLTSKFFCQANLGNLFPTHYHLQVHKSLIHMALLNSFSVQLLHCCYLHQLHLPVQYSLQVFISINQLAIIKLKYFGVLLPAKGKAEEKKNQAKRNKLFANTAWQSGRSPTCKFQTLGKQLTSVIFKTILDSGVPSFKAILKNQKGF